MNPNDRMIRSQVSARGVSDESVLEAMRSVPRELFVPPHLRDHAYDDTPLTLEHGQTISQPYIVAFMTEQLRLRGHERVLEIGTGSGYQTAILARLSRQVYTAELEPELAATVPQRLEALGIENVVLGLGDGVEIFRDRAPFDAILAAAAAEEMPQALLDQLAEGGRCVLPVGGTDMQYLWRIERVNGKLVRHQLDPVRFVPLRRGLPAAG